jgi:hypothetical protein
MAIATSTAIAAASLAATAASTGMSFAQAGKQKQAQRNAERDADQAMQEARKKLEVNFYDNLSIQKEPYELEREALLAQGAQAIQAGVESERGAAATAGRIQMAQQEGQAGVRSAFGQELSALEKLSAQEDSRLRDIGAQIDLGEVEGAQLAAANAQELRARSMEQGMQGVTSLGKQAVSYIPLFSGKDAVTPDDASFGSDWNKNQINQYKQYVNSLQQPNNQPMNLNSLQKPNNQPINFNSLQQPIQFEPLYKKPFQQPYSFNPFFNLSLPK